MPKFEKPFFTDSDNDALHIDFTQRLCHTLLPLLAKDVHNNVSSKNWSQALSVAINSLLDQILLNHPHAARKKRPQTYNELSRREEEYCESHK